MEEWLSVSSSSGFRVLNIFIMIFRLKHQLFRTSLHWTLPKLSSQCTNAYGTQYSRNGPTTLWSVTQRRIFEMVSNKRYAEPSKWSLDLFLRTVRKVRKTLDMDYLWSVTQRRIFEIGIKKEGRGAHNLRNRVLTYFCVRYAKPLKCSGTQNPGMLRNAESS